MAVLCYSMVFNQKNTFLTYQYRYTKRDLRADNAIYRSLQGVTHPLLHKITTSNLCVHKHMEKSYKYKLQLFIVLRHQCNNCRNYKCGWIKILACHCARSRNSRWMVWQTLQYALANHCCTISPYLHIASPHAYHL
jgi:hypothetical protein